MTTDRTFRWVVRGVFAACLIYIYFGVCRQPVFAKYKFLLENVFLAYVPIELSFHLEERTPRLIFWLVFPFWFFFYPNAPYMLTDFFHLALDDPYIIRANGARTGLLRPDMRMWLMFANLSVTALLSTFVGVLTLHRVVSVLLRRQRWWSMWRHVALMLAFTVIASVGIYIGRFPRIHTAHIVTQPAEALRRIAEFWDVQLPVFTAILTSLQMFVWGLLLLIGRCRFWQ